MGLDTGSRSCELESRYSKYPLATHPLQQVRSYAPVKILVNAGPDPRQEKDCGDYTSLTHARQSLERIGPKGFIHTAADKPASNDRMEPDIRPLNLKHGFL